MSYAYDSSGPVVNRRFTGADIVSAGAINMRNRIARQAVLPAYVILVNHDIVSLAISVEDLTGHVETLFVPATTPWFLLNSSVARLIGAGTANSVDIQAYVGFALP